MTEKLKPCWKCDAPATTDMVWEHFYNALCTECGESFEGAKSREEATTEWNKLYEDNLALRLQLVPKSYLNGLIAYQKAAKHHELALMVESNGRCTFHDVSEFAKSQQQVIYRAISENVDMECELRKATGALKECKQYLRMLAGDEFTGPEEQVGVEKAVEMSIDEVLSTESSEKGCNLPEPEELECLICGMQDDIELHNYKGVDLPLCEYHGIQKE